MSGSSKRDRAAVALAEDGRPIGHEHLSIACGRPGSRGQHVAGAIEQLKHEDRGRTRDRPKKRAAERLGLSGKAASKC